MDEAVIFVFFPGRMHLPSFNRFILSLFNFLEPLHRACSGLSCIRLIIKTSFMIFSVASSANLRLPRNRVEKAYRGEGKA